MSGVSFKFPVTHTSQSHLSAVDWDNLPFGKIFADHMFVMEYANGEWQKGEIIPFGPIDMHPAMSAIHYGQSIFEGMKAYRNQSNEVVLFRPELNARRFAESAARMCMPEIPEDLFLEAVKQLVSLDAAWVTDKPGYALYIRPFMFATDEFVGIKPSDTYKFVIINSPVGAYYAEPVRVKIEEHYTRAAVGGVGRAKAAGNYGASLYPAKLAQQQGFHQLVWTDAKTHTFIEESGTMNIVFVIDDKIITPTEEADTILRGTTKKTVLELARQWGIPVEERPVTVAEIIDAAKTGKLQDAFGAGTAATIAPIALIGFRDEKITLPALETRTLSLKIKAHLDGVKSGAIEDTMHWVQKVG
ncbi:MAG: branched-chain amino acid aminotransferase [Flavobacteriia bacterium]|nr:branched-chain amino acid aminotransferase [Flavobacteriia bacterium]